MQQTTIAFFGTPHYSLLVLEPLYQASFPINVVITKPDLPAGRKQILTTPPVAAWAKMHKLPLIQPQSDTEKPWLFANPEDVTQEVLKYKPEILITADYVQKVPSSLIDKVKFGGINVHPSLLPAYRGPAPVPWALMQGEVETGVSLVTLGDVLDEGKIIAQEKVIISATDTTDTLMTTLFTKGGQLITKLLSDYIQNPDEFNVTSTTVPSYYSRMNRDTGFEPWERVKIATLQGTDSERIERKWRALHPWPGLWTKIIVDGKEKRLKILKTHLSVNSELRTTNLVLDTIQFEGKMPQEVTESVLSKLGLKQ